ncbi:MAG: DUF177 domain-containing protein [Clostridia bacterium]|nr:DUF177 domain-containing protein [Clostridia bacterium]
MIIDISTILTGEKLSLDIDYKIEKEDAAVLAENLFGAAVTSPVSVTGNIKNNGGCVSLTVSSSFDYESECARCLAPVSGSFTIDLVRTVAATGTITGDEEDYVIAEEGKIDIDEELCEELLLSFPSKILCDEDCPGLCPKCGKPKREGKCGCPEKEIDPRLKILAQLLEK